MPFRNEKQKPRETGKYYSGAAKPRARSSVLQVLFLEKSYATIIQGESRLVNALARAHPWPPGGKKGLWSYVYNEIQVPSEEKGESCEGLHFDIPVVESCGTCKNACNAKVEISTTKGGSRASTKRL